MLTRIHHRLWQRLPRRPDDKTRSVMLAQYPVHQPELDNPSAEEAYEVVLGSSKGIRSLMAEYALKDEVKSEDPVHVLSKTTETDAVI